MADSIATPRYSAEDFETASVRSAAPSYSSDAPSYHTLPYNHSEVIPPYSPPVSRTATLVASTSTPLFAPGRQRATTSRQQTIGLPPLPPAPTQSSTSIQSFRLPTWSASNAPAARHYRNVAERRITSGRYAASSEPVAQTSSERIADDQPETQPEARPLEDPYLVGEVAAAQARRDRLLRETGDDILLREDRQWDWLLAQMRGWEERERSWARFRRDFEGVQRKKLLRRIGGRLLPT
ncbi:hypothetical protein E4U52_006699 [Claviceps spartinae]|nr:hypothetical protein E4U52_006699 [Claviceps spartinae]KAG6107019.1 hypothetical protein E4U31_000377 [Claviceps sp. LM219 group G6]